MKLLVIRHGAAIDQEEFAKSGESDDLRPLTREGRKEMKKVARGLRSEVDSLDVLATSPLVRARETAEIVGKAYDIDDPEVTDTLVPGSAFEDFEKWCATRGESDTIAVVGHEPHLSSLVTWLLTGEQDSRIRLKKAGACLLEFDSSVKRGAGTLNWLLTARQLARSSR